ncbi:hypothetical protein AMECASPLE_038947 [Ameca splendens]|uniref:Uncharacterized protein n=1 Tax=Ameca splendens TaxID=208324 RepID=A0ABV1AFD3_9TELE
MRTNHQWLAEPCVLVPHGSYTGILRSSEFLTSLLKMFRCCWWSYCLTSGQTFINEGKPSTVSLFLKQKYEFGEINLSVAQPRMITRSLGVDIHVYIKGWC